MTIIGLKELRQNASQIAERAQKGERFTVVKRSKPMFEIVPMNHDKVRDLWTIERLQNDKSFREKILNQDLKSLKEDIAIIS